ncbi:DUF4376 domain-containing protein [Azospirillum agricola]|uniref:DUF4376 domain-containing protein n=1 Tax=Azospirillum agricola TaxID=1720247 RepID=UPI000A0F192D|nr:DUF4376 domain-containing protein [Azospirillum agricola]SMH30525.1 protein of unknown function [Azospirillum lipoferum]
MAWTTWTAEDWATLCPDVRLLPVVDEPPSVTADQRLVRHAEEAWTLGADAVTVRYDVVDLTPAELAAQLAADRAAKIQQVNAERDRRYDAGFAFEGNIYQIDVESRTDMLAIEAKLNRGEASPHGGYWRSKSNVMVPMDDVKVAAFIGLVEDHVGAIKAQSWVLKDAAAVSPDPASIDHTAGWPDNGWRRDNTPALTDPAPARRLFHDRRIR